MNTPLPLWRRLWASLPLSYRLVLFGLSTVMMATVVVMAATYVSAGESLKVQLERQISRDLNVFEKWYRTRLEEMQLTSVGLVRHDELARAVATGDLAPAAPLLAAEVDRLKLNVAVLVDREGRIIGPDGRGARFDPHGVVGASMARGEQVVSTENWSREDLGALPEALRHPGLVRLVVTPVGPATSPAGALVLGEWVDAASPVPGQVAALVGGGIGLLSPGEVVASSGFPAGTPDFSPAVWEDVRQGRYFFVEEDYAGTRYLFMFRPIADYQGRPIGAFLRGFPEDTITETLHRYAGGIFMLTAAAVLFSLLAFLWLTRQLLFPLRQLAGISAKLAEGEDVVVPSPGPGKNDELKRLEHGVALLADRLMQSREELAETAVKLEVEAHQLALLNQEKARLLEAIREHDRMRGHLLEKIISAQEDERKRIARELHDETGQSLTSLLVGLKFVEGARTLEDARARCGDLKALTVQTLEEVHKLSVALRPAMLDDLGLVVTLRSMLNDFAQAHGVEARFRNHGFEGRFPSHWEVTLYRVVQEALTNVAKYARASCVEVDLAVEGDQLRLTVSDDGVGFEPDAVRHDEREHLGLAGMQERVALIGGEFKLESAPGAGTTITITAERPSEAASPEGSSIHVS